MSFILNCIIQGARWTTDYFMYVLSKNDEWMAHTLSLSLPLSSVNPQYFPSKESIPGDEHKGSVDVRILLATQ